MYFGRNGWPWGFRPAYAKHVVVLDVIVIVIVIVIVWVFITLHLS